MPNSDQIFDLLRFENNVYVDLSSNPSDGSDDEKDEQRFDPRNKPQSSSKSPQSKNNPFSFREQGSNLTVPEGGQSGGGVSRGSGSNARAETPELTRRPDKSSSKKGLLKVLAPRTIGKRQSEFLKFFKEEIPENEPLIADFR